MVFLFPPRLSPSPTSRVFWYDIRMSRYYVTGTAGAGKSTLAKELKKRGVFTIDIDAEKNLCHWKSKKTGKKADYHHGIGAVWIERHVYFCDPEKLEKLMKHKNNVIVFGRSSNEDDIIKKIRQSVPPSM